MPHYLLAKERMLFAGAYKSFKKRVKDLGDFKVAFSEKDKGAILLTLELLAISRLNMQDAENEIRENAAGIHFKED